jgi:hypothetical protein
MPNVIILDLRHLIYWVGRINQTFLVCIVEKRKSVIVHLVIIANRVVETLKVRLDPTRSVTNPAQSLHLSTAGVGLFDVRALLP